MSLRAVRGGISKFLDTALAPKPEQHPPLSRSEYLESRVYLQFYGSFYRLQVSVTVRSLFETFSW